VHIRLVGHHQSIIEQDQERVAVEFAQDHPGYLVQPIVGSHKKYEIYNGCDRGDSAGLDSQTYDLQCSIQNFTP
jgi:hypothetical protein